MTDLLERLAQRPPITTTPGNSGSAMLDVAYAIAFANDMRRRAEFERDLALDALADAMLVIDAFRSECGNRGLDGDIRKLRTILAALEGEAK